MIEDNLRFRASRETECFQGEPKIWAKELWYHGYGKIAVIPSVNLEYSDEAAKKIKALKGYASSWVEAEGKEGLRIQWDEKPPEKVKCIPTYQNQTWPPWDEGLRELQQTQKRRLSRFHDLVALTDAQHASSDLYK